MVLQALWEGKAQKIMTKALSLLIALLLAGCASNNRPEPEPNQRKHMHDPNRAKLIIEWDHPYPELVVFDILTSSTLTNWALLLSTTNLSSEVENQNGAGFFRVGARWKETQ